MSERPQVWVHVDRSATPETLASLARCLLQAAKGYPEVVDLLPPPTETISRRRGMTATMQKAVNALVQTPLSPPELDALWHEAAHWGTQWPCLLAETLDILLPGLDAPERLQKASGALNAPPWSVDRWKSFTALLDRLSSAVVARLAGVQTATTLSLSPHVLPERLHNLFGRTVAAALQRRPLPLYIGEASPRVPRMLPLTTVEQAAITYAQQQAAARLRPLFTRLANQLTVRMLAAERQAVQTRTSAALAARRGPGHLARLLAEDAGSFERDWRRVARTELQDAWNQGAAAALLSRHARMGTPTDADGLPQITVYKIPATSACTHCLAMWLGPDHAPRLYPLATILHNPSNEGRRYADWLPQTGIQHPNCTCGPLQEYTAMVEPVFQRMRDTWLQRRP